MSDVFNNEFVGVSLTLTKLIGIDVRLQVRTPLIVGDKYYYRDDEHWEGQTVISGAAGGVTVEIDSNGVQVPGSWAAGTVFGIALDLKINDVVFTDVESFPSVFMIPVPSLEWIRVDAAEPVVMYEEG